MQEILSVIIALLTAHISDQGSTSFGPAEPTSETCATYKCPENSNCNDTYGYLACICVQGKTGLNCDIDDPCLINGTCPGGSVCFGDCPPNMICEGATGTAHCRGCVAGYTGLHCELDLNECEGDPYPCMNGGVCTNTHGDFICKCQATWTGKNCSCKKGTSCDLENIVDDNTDGRGGSEQNLCNINVILLIATSLSAFLAS